MADGTGPCLLIAVTPPAPLVTVTRVRRRAAAASAVPDPEMSLSKRERKRFRAIFNSFDSNGDGTLSHSEFRHALDGVGYCLCDNDLKRFIAEADTDRSGKITFDEFIAAMKKPSPKQQRMAKLRRLFNAMDADKSGYITIKDLKILAKNPDAEQMSEDEMKRAIERMDKNGDNKVSFDEFVQSMKDE